MEHNHSRYSCMYHNNNIEFHNNKIHNGCNCKIVSAGHTSGFNVHTCVCVYVYVHELWKYFSLTRFPFVDWKWKLSSIYVPYCMCTHQIPISLETEWRREYTLCENKIHIHSWKELCMYWCMYLHPMRLPGDFPQYNEYNLASMWNLGIFKNCDCVKWYIIQLLYKFFTNTRIDDWQ